jgi:hypothetical protein
MNEATVKPGNGIKGINFRPGNGESHRAGAARRKARQIGNRNVRASINQGRSRMSPAEYHASLAAIGNNK